MKNLQKKTESESFFQRTYEVAKLIPRGRVTSYGAIARFIGTPGASRMVGWALNASHAQEDFVPAHRVVNRNGFLTGKAHFRYPELMQELLESENVTVKNDRVVDFKMLFWDPSIELV